jgi:hypothetical protein
VSVILSGAKDLLFSGLKTKADSSLPVVAQNDAPKYLLAGGPHLPLG